MKTVRCELDKKFCSLTMLDDEEIQFYPGL